MSSGVWTSAPLRLRKKTFDFDKAVVFFVPTTPGVFDKNWGNLGPKLGLNFKADDILLYASYSRGFRSGGFSGRAFDPRNLGPYAPEHVDAYKVGLKRDLIDEKLRLNLSSYYNRYKDLQRPFPNSVGYNGTLPNPLELITFNAAAADMEGLEAEITALPRSGLTFTTSLDYLHAKYNGFKDPATGASLDYLKLVYAPAFSGRLSAIYHEELTPDWFGEFSADYAYSTSLETDTLNAPVGHRDPTNIVNVELSLAQEQGPLKLTFWVKNLTNDIYVVSAQTGAPYFSIFAIDAPRTYGITAAVKF
jgi:iron complex outermembrane receptor protein